MSHLVLCWIQLYDGVNWTDKQHSYLVLCPPGEAGDILTTLHKNGVVDVPRRANPIVLEFVRWWLEEHRAAGNPVPGYTAVHVFPAATCHWGMDAAEIDYAPMGFPRDTLLLHGEYP